MTDTTPLTDEQLATIRAYHERTTHPAWREESHIGQLLAEVDRLRVELGKYVGHEPTLREEMAELGRRLDAVHALHQPAQHCGLTIYDECSTKRSTGPGGAWERHTVMPWPCSTVAAANGETPPADGWVICSPAWLAAGGDCHNAPRRPASDPRYSHEHPAVSVPSA